MPIVLRSGVGGNATSIPLHGLDGEARAPAIDPLSLAASYRATLPLAASYRALAALAASYRTRVALRGRTRHG